MIDYVTTGTLARHIVATILITAGIAKVFHFSGFVRALAPLVFRAKHSRFAAPLSAGVVFSEVVIGTLMFLNVSPASVAGAGLIGAFALVVALALIRSPEPVKCGCFSLNSIATWGSVYRNLGFVSLAIGASGFAPAQSSIVGGIFLVISLIGPIIAPKKEAVSPNAVVG